MWADPLSRTLPEVDSTRGREVCVQFSTEVGIFETYF
jgi:hypothetical protein